MSQRLDARKIEKRNEKKERKQNFWLRMQTSLRKCSNLSADYTISFMYKSTLM